MDFSFWLNDFINRKVDRFWLENFHEIIIFNWSKLITFFGYLRIWPLWYGFLSGILRSHNFDFSIMKLIIDYWYSKPNKLPGITMNFYPGNDNPCFYAASKNYTLPNFHYDNNLNVIPQFSDPLTTLANVWATGIYLTIWEFNFRSKIEPLKFQRWELAALEKRQFAGMKIF